MAQYHWYFVAAAYGITAILSLAVLTHSWWRMAQAERRAESQAKISSRPINIISNDVATDSQV